MKLSRLIRRDLDAPSLRERVAGLRAGLSRLGRRPEPQEADAGRRAVMSGALAAAVPLPALAAPVVLPAPHPDQALLDLGAAQAAAWATVEATEAAWRVARAAVNQVLVECPGELMARRSEFQTLTHPLAWSPRGWGHVRFRYIPRGLNDPDIEHWQTQSWTGAALRQAIARAPFAQGRGGLTPFLIRRWKMLLPVADAFDPLVEAAETSTKLARLRQERDAATKAHRDLTVAIERSVAITPEGLAVLVHAIRLTPWQDVWGAWPNLLRSAANIAGIDPASLDHEYASTRRPRA